MASSPTVKPLTAQVGPAHGTIQAQHPVSKLVYPVYKAPTVTDSKGNDVTPSAFSVIKGNEILGPFADPIVARDEAARRMQLDIERGVSNP